MARHSSRRSFPVSLGPRLSRERHRLLRLPRSEVHPLSRLRAFAALRRLSRGADAALHRHELPARLGRRALLAARLGRRGDHDQGADRFHGRPEFFALGGVGGAQAMLCRISSASPVLGIWLIFSTIAAPVIIQKAISTGAQIGSALAAGAATAGVAAATTGAATAAAIGGGGGAMAAVGGIAGGAAAGGPALAELVHERQLLFAGGRNARRSLASQRRSKQPAKDDLSGDKAVRELLASSRN